MGASLFKSLFREAIMSLGVVNIITKRYFSVKSDSPEMTLLILYLMDNYPAIRYAKLKKKKWSHFFLHVNSQLIPHVLVFTSTLSCLYLILPCSITTDSHRII